MKSRKGQNWIPLWTDSWLFGSTRLELEPGERSIWIDLLALGSKDEGFIRAGKDIPYSFKQLAGFLCVEEELLQSTIRKCLKVGKLEECKNKTFRIANWNKYQISERYKRKLRQGSSEKAEHSSEKAEERGSVAEPIGEERRREDIIGEDIKREDIKENNISTQVKLNKDKFKDFVFLTQIEYEKLKKQLSKAKVDDYIDKLNDYIGSKGKRYKSHYHTILVWVKKDEEAENGAHKREGGKSYRGDTGAIHGEKGKYSGLKKTVIEV